MTGFPWEFSDLGGAGKLDINLKYNVIVGVRPKSCWSNRGQLLRFCQFQILKCIQQSQSCSFDIKWRELSDLCLLRCRNKTRTIKACCRLTLSRSVAGLFCCLQRCVVIRPSYHPRLRLCSDSWKWLVKNLASWFHKRPKLWPCRLVFTSSQPLFYDLGRDSGCFCSLINLSHTYH